MKEDGQPTTHGGRDLETWRRIERVFSPSLAEKRSKLYGRGERASRFIHYTSAENAFKIINSREFWLRNVRCMNDHREVTHGCDSILRHLRDVDSRQRLASAMHAIAPGAFESALADFNKMTQEGHLELGTYIGSLSEHPNEEDKHGRLSMWREYGGKAGCVGIVLNIPRESRAAADLGVAFSPVAYMDDDKVRGWLDDVAQRSMDELDFLRSLGVDGLRRAIVQMLVIAATCMKHEGFSEEREWRLVHNPNLMHGTGLRAQFELIGGIPQKVCCLPLGDGDRSDAESLAFSDLFERIIIGPTTYKFPILDSLVHALEAAGVRDPMGRISFSDIPLRGYA
ncbi:MAG: DUF2971 domain-containing protein [Verrucomicrobiota bacterium]|jgi:hypothetical protein